MREALRAYLPPARTISGVDPLLALVGVIEDDEGPDDLARELDHFAYGVAKGHKDPSRR